MQFIANVVKGSGRGNRIGTPTFNLNLEQVPSELEYGIYASKIQILNSKHQKNSKFQIPSILHYGPRPVFKDTVSCEVHILAEPPPESPDTLTIDIVRKIRDVQDFPSVEALKTQIQNDIVQARAILKTCSTD